MAPVLIAAPLRRLNDDGASFEPSLVTKNFPNKFLLLLFVLLQLEDGDRKSIPGATRSVVFVVCNCRVVGEMFAVFLTFSPVADARWPMNRETVTSAEAGERDV